jgi:hypothetical protein
MKLTKKKLEQLIMEEYKSMSRQIFDKRREFPEGALVRAFGDEDQPINRPELHDKLTTLAGSDFNQARELADALDEPLDIKLDPSNMEIMQPHKRNIDQIFDDNHMLHFDFILDGGASSFEEEPDIGEVTEFAERKGLDPEETYEKIMSNYRKLMMQLFVNAPKSDYERNKEFKKQLEKQFGVDLRSYKEKYGPK